MEQTKERTNIYTVTIKSEDYPGQEVLIKVTNRVLGTEAFTKQVAYVCSKAFSDGNETN